MNKPVLAANWHDRPEMLLRVINSTASHVSGYCISVEPSATEVAEFLVREFDQRGIPHHVYPFVRTNGGEIRTNVMQEGEAFAKKIGAEYLVNVDADDLLEFTPDFAWNLTADCYMIMEQAGAVSYPFRRIFKVGLDWRWWGPLHEVPHCAAVPLGQPTAVHPGVIYRRGMDGGVSGGRGDPKVRYSHHADLCRGWLTAHPGEDAALTDRMSFYLAQSLRDAERLPEALEAYEAYLVMPACNPEQRFVAAFEAARIMATLLASPNDVLLAVIRAHVIGPHRAEALRVISRLASGMADQLPVPEQALFCVPSEYGPR